VEVFQHKQRAAVPLVDLLQRGERVAGAGQRALHIRHRLEAIRHIPADARATHPLAQLAHQLQRALLFDRRQHNQRKPRPNVEFQLVG